VTFAARLGTLRYIETLGIMQTPDDDYYNSGRIVDAGANIVLPLPGLAAHIENADVLEPVFTPLYYNYMDYARRLRKEIAAEEFNLWE